MTKLTIRKKDLRILDTEELLKLQDWIYSELNKRNLYFEMVRN